MKRLRVFGHPIHPPLVHAPMTLLPLSFLLDAWAQMASDAHVGSLARWSLSGGLVVAVPAAIAGLLDFLAIPAGDASERTANRHFVLMGAAVLLFLAAWLLPGHSLPTEAQPWTHTAALVCSGAGTLGMLVGARSGGDLVYHHGVGQSGKQTP